MTAPQTAQQSAGRDWRTLAACVGTDPELYFPAAETGPGYDAQVAAAKTVCAGCPVVAACLAEALARIPDGIAGGLTADERRALRRRDHTAVTAARRAVAAAQRANTDQGTAQDGGQAA